MGADTVTKESSTHRSQAGFSLPELLIAVTVLLIISSAVTSALLQMTSSQRTIWNRTQLHAGVRSATELLQQEVGQAGRIALPGIATLAGAIPLGAGVQTVGVLINGAVPLTMTGFFIGEKLVIDVGGPTPPPCVAALPCQETVTVTGVNAAKQITATFAYPHPAGAAVQALGGFGTGIVPPLPYPNGSDGSTLKLFGDINGDGNMVYVEYTCDPAPGGTGNLYRNVMPYDQAPPSPAPTSGQILLGNIQTNPGGTACFTYMPNPLVSVVNPALVAEAYVLDVAITLTVQTQVIDPVTKQFQKETKALLNVSPRNVFNVWQLASTGFFDRVQPIPPSVIALLP